jgi:DNA-binding NtrC family response regulator
MQWPGNVRELENRIQRAAIMAENGKVTPEDLGLTSVYTEYGQGLFDAREALDRQMIEAALGENKRKPDSSRDGTGHQQTDAVRTDGKTGGCPGNDWRLEEPLNG